MQRIPVISNIIMAAMRIGLTVRLKAMLSNPLKPAVRKPLK